ncbi:MAG: major capsid protein [Candidatus Cloacimonetes bacterium]|nr:major capsid protein [Candidatus Cloacimonadota bacterium]
MAVTLADFLEGKATIAYLKQRPSRQFILEGILPYKSIDTLEYEHIIGDFMDPVVADFVAYGADGKYVGRDGLKKFIEELKPIRIHRRLDGKLLINAKKYKTDEPIVKELFNDVGYVYDSVRVRVEKMRADVLTSGKLTATGNVAFSVDYGIPTENQKSPAVLWSDTTNSNPIQDMIDWYNTLDFEPEGGIISKEILNYLVQNVNVRKAIHGDNGANQYVTLEMINNLLSQLGLPKLAVNKDYYRAADGSKAYFWPSNKMVWVGSNIGYALMGPTEESVLEKGVVKTDKGIYVQVVEEQRPPRIITTGSATSIIALPGVNEIFIATVLA